MSSPHQRAEMDTFSIHQVGAIYAWLTPTSIQIILQGLLRKAARQTYEAL